MAPGYLTVQRGVNQLTNMTPEYDDAAAGGVDELQLALSTRPPTKTRQRWPCVCSTRS